MRPFSKMLISVLVGVFLIGADGPATRPAIIDAPMRTYRAAIQAADKEHDKAVLQARAQLVTDLKAAKRSAMLQDDLPGAIAAADLITTYSDSHQEVVMPTTAAVHAVSRHSSPASLPPNVGELSVAGTTWEQADGRIVRFLPDGTFDSPRDGKCYWHVVGPRTILTVSVDHTDWICIYRFAEDGKSFERNAFQIKSESFQSKPALHGTLME